MITGILLAAGVGSRFGSHYGSQKLLARLPDGRRIIDASVANLAAACGGNIVVVTRRDPELTHVLQTSGCEIVINENAEQGMGTSIVAGVAATPAASGWLIALGDMPSVRIDTMTAVVDALRNGARIVVPTMAGRRGHPVGFSAKYWVRLQSLTGDIGARKIIAADAIFVEEISVDDAGIFADIDTPADLEV